MEKKTISKLAPMLRIWLISKLANGTQRRRMIKVPNESFEKFKVMRKYVEKINLHTKENSQFANWLITTFANLRWWPFVFYKFLVYLFIT